MITEFTLECVFDCVNFVLDLLPEISWSVDSTGFSYFLGILQTVGYFMPMGTVCSIFFVSFCITIFKILISAVSTIWDLLPFA